MTGHERPSISWPMVALAAVVLAATVAAPRFGASPGDVLAAVAAVTGFGALAYGRQAARQTNGVLDSRMDAAVQRGIAAALDGQPPVESGPAPAGGVSYGAGPAPAPYADR
ncbi:hypothetical protein C5N14_30840 [Micromonospora sp. MW-13]|uniref:hypothetical protein n=1 Tax=Micromonospora sp. MW-13 TaxID=2094022 RepID=UPI000E450268|nr:hypothetical protein [Micromonospora sp. MW-13]RGC64990.1 hypothetical protein C5N14_30840 [Micromonospora sp. MW-13]